MKWWEASDVTRCKHLCLLFAAVALTTACATPVSVHEQQSVLISATYRAAESLMGDHRGDSRISAQSGKAVLIATIVDLNDLDKSSPLGRVMSEQVSARLAQMGLNVKEAKLRGNLFVSHSQGELLLSREVREISRAHNAEYVVVGTYTAASEAVYVTLKLVNTEDSRVENGYSFALVNSGNIQSMLK